MPHYSYLSLGSSHGDRLAFLKDAILQLQNNCGRITAISPVYETEPWGFNMQGSFLNLAVCIETLLDPQSLLHEILQIEMQMGRVRSEKNVYRSRTIDIDIIFYDDLKVDSDNLVIPHPHAHERKFVLVPLSQIAAEFNHPEFNITVSELLKKCSDECIVALTDIKI